MRSLGLEFGETAVRWVELAEDRGRVTLRSSGVVGLSGGGASDEAEALRSLVAAHRLRGREVVTALPRAAATLRWLSLPAATREENGFARHRSEGDPLRGMVELEASRSLPFPIEEAAWDFLSLPGGDGRQQALFVAARRGMVQERRRALEAAGLRIGAVSIDALAAVALYRAALPEAQESAILIHREGETATLSWVQGERLLLSRAVTPGPVAAEGLATEVRRTLLAGAFGSGGEAKPAAGAIWLTGPEASAELAVDLASVLAAETAGPACVRVLPRSLLPRGEELATELDTALGLALLGLRPAGERLDLARQVRPAPTAGAQGAKRRAPLVVGAVAVAVAALLFVMPGAGDRELSATAARAGSEARQMAARREQMEERVRMLRGAVIPEHSYLDVLNDVSALAGPDVWLTQFVYDRGRPLVIRGAARSRAAVAGLVEGLRGSRHLERVTLGAVTQSAEEKEIVQFSVTGTLRGDAPLQARRRRGGATSGSGEGA